MLQPEINFGRINVHYKFSPIVLLLDDTHWKLWDPLPVCAMNEMKTSCRPILVTLKICCQCLLLTKDATYC